MSIAAVNPATGRTIREYREMTAGEVAEIVEKAASAYESWRRVPIAERADRMRSAAALLRAQAGEYGRLMAEEMGKPVRDGRGEAEKCAWVCDYYADQAEAFLQREYVETDAGASFITYQPLGPILAVMPWNFPFWQVFRFAAPNLMAGNVGLLKHASNVPGCALAIEDIFRRAGFPDSAFRTLLVGSDQVNTIIENPRIRGVTLTGSTPAGRAVARQAGEMLKKTVLELGGSDPYIILDDADLDLAVETCVASRLINSGQSCIAAKRFIVTEKNRKPFEERFVSQMRTIVMGDPLQEETQVGPQARRDLRDDLHQQVTESQRQGARLLLGGELPTGPGAYYPPTVLTDVSPGMPAYEEELFGPVAAIIPVPDESEALRIANDSSFGLGAALFTRDLENGQRLAVEEIEAGNVFVNGFVKSDPRLPFGGIKESGYGRELGKPGIREFLNIKTVWVR